MGTQYDDRPWFDPTEARARIAAQGATAAELSPTVPNFTPYLREAADRFPNDWATMTRPHGGTGFARKAASFIHYEKPSGHLCGLNGKYGKADDPSDDGFAIWDDSSPIVDINTGRNFAFIDWCASAGSPAASLVWQNLSGTTLSKGLWVQPARVHDGGTGGGGTGGGGTPAPPIKPTPEDLIKLLPDRGRAMDFMRWLHAHYKSPAGLNRPLGLWTPLPAPPEHNGEPDFEGLGAWAFDVWLREAIRGKSEEQARATLVAEINKVKP